MDARIRSRHDGVAWMSATFHLRPYSPEDEDAAIALWQQTWQQAYPDIDFAARVPWWRERWRKDLVPNAAIIVAGKNRGGVWVVVSTKTPPPHFYLRWCAHPPLS